MVKEKPRGGFMGILIQVVYTACVKGRRAALYSMNNISLVEKKFCKVGAVLPRNPGNEGGFPHRNFSLSNTVGSMRALYFT